MINTDNVSEIHTEATDAQVAESLVQQRQTADSSAQKSALNYLCDFDAQERKLKAKYTRAVESALADGDIEKLEKLVSQARKAGVEF